MSTNKKVKLIFQPVGPNRYCERKHFTDNISAGSTPGFSDIEKFKLNSELRNLKHVL